MNLLKLIDQRNSVKAQLDSLISTAETEQRMLNESEDTKLTELKDEYRTLNEQITNKQEIKTITMKNFSLLQTIGNVVNRRSQEDSVQELIELGKAELRKAGQTADGDVVIPMELRADITAESGAGIAKETADLVTALKANLVLLEAGANYMGGLTGNIGIPTYTGTNVGWAGEVEAATDGAGTLAEVMLKPKRLTAYVDISKQFLMQESADAERILRDDIAKAISQKLEATVLGAEAGSETKPAGLFNGVVAAAFDAEAVDEALDLKNVQNKTYILSPTAKTAFRAEMVNPMTPLFSNKEVDGYPTFITSNVVADGFIAGDFSDLVIAQWGGLDITVDPYTQANKGKVRLVVNCYFDAVKRRDSFEGRIIE